MRICRWWNAIPHIVRKHFHILLHVTLVKFENIHLWQVVCEQLMPKGLEKQYFVNKEKSIFKGPQIPADDRHFQ